jgi:membrane associated rhomboid family serine protease
VGCELAANLLTLALKRGIRTYRSLGASGAISGVVLSFCLFEPMAKIFIMFIPVGVPAFLYAIFYILYSTYAMRDDLRGSIAHEAHLGGAIAGIVLTLILRPDALGMFLSNFTG